MAIIDFFDHGWSIDPQGAAYIQDEFSYSFTEVDELSCRVAHKLLRIAQAPSATLRVLEVAVPGAGRP